ncbi:ribosomal oxygenase 2-like [Sycon ciliatum]|uniref:ribosomal oxygenase 2-like n=1 Tax=Sycon ciliatum TaxID=27933 RepID=UPI0031F6B9EF
MAKRSASEAQEVPWWAQETPENVFASLLGNTNAKDFFAKNWEKEPLVIPAAKAQRNGKLTQLFSREALDKILKKEKIDFGLHLNSCRYVDGARENTNPAENEETGEPTRATAKRVWKLFDGDRATVQFHQPQQFQDSLWHLCSSLESFFGCLVGSNIYMTPGDSQGLAPHHDDVEVFIIQLEGRKHWRLYSPAEKLARTCSDDLDTSDIGDPTHDIVLEAGDVMYFPRGTIHQADTPAGVPHSTHITISTYQNWTYGELLQIALPFAIEEAMKDESASAFRQGLPLNVMSSAGSGQVSGADRRTTNAEDSVKSTLATLVQKLSSYVSPASAVDLLSSDFLRNRLPPPPAYSATEPAPEEPAAKRKKGKGKKEDAVDVVDLTAESGAGDPVGPKPTAGSKVCLLHRNHMRVIVGQNIDDPDEDDADMMEDEFDDDSDSDEDGNGKDGSEEDDDDDDDENAADDAKENGAIAKCLKKLGGCGDDANCCGDDDSCCGDEAEEDACYIYFDFGNMRRMHMTRVSGFRSSLSSIRLPMSAVPAVGKLLSQLKPVSVSDLGLEADDALDLVTNLWAVGLLSAH